jgi:hypothetical protein
MLRFDANMTHFGGYGQNSRINNSIIQKNIRKIKRKNVEAVRYRGRYADGRVVENPFVSRKIEE